MFWLYKYPIEPISHPHHDMLNGCQQGRAEVRQWVEEFTAIIGNYFRISTRLNIFAASRKIHEARLDVYIEFCTFSERKSFKNVLPSVRLRSKHFGLINSRAWGLRTLETSQRLTRVVCFLSRFFISPPPSSAIGPDLWGFVLSDPALFSNKTPK